MLLKYVNFHRFAYKIILPVCSAAVLHPAENQNSEENASTRTAGEETKPNQVNGCLWVVHGHLCESFQITTGRKLALCDFGRYIPSATAAVYDVLKEMAQSHALKKKRFEREDAELLSKVSEHVITKDTLAEKLAQHVEQVIACFYSTAITWFHFAFYESLLRAGKFGYPSKSFLYDSHFMFFLLFLEVFRA